MALGFFKKKPEGMINLTLLLTKELVVCYEFPAVSLFDSAMATNTASGENLSTSYRFMLKVNSQLLTEVAVVEKQKQNSSE